MTPQQLLHAGKLQIVGSILTGKRRPRDLDLVLIVPAVLFVRLFGGTVQQWLDEGETGAWTAVRDAWSAHCVRLSHHLERRLRCSLPVDCKIIPDTVPQYGERGAYIPKRGAA